MERISSGSPWEPKSGYSRAVKANNMLLVPGTAATDPGEAVIGKHDLYRQTQVVLDKMRSASADRIGLTSILRRHLRARAIESAG